MSTIQTVPIPPAALAAGRRLLADADGCADPVASARLLPRAAYVDPDVFEFEKHTVFAREWLCIAHENEVPEPGDVLALTVVDEPLLVVRGADGDVRVLSAICQHRGHPLFDGLGALGDDAGCIKAKRFTCPYHNWVFGLDGRLAAAPSMQETTPVESLRATVALPTVRSEVFHGLVFVNFDESAASLAPTLGKLDEELTTFGLSELVAMPGYTRTGLGWNWKLHHDNALEPYHTAYVHRGVHEAAPATNARFGDFARGDGQVMHPTYLVSEDASLDNESGARLTATIPGLGDEQRQRVMFASVPPLLFAILQPTFVSLSFVLPVAHDEIALRRVDLYPKVAVEEEGFAEAYAAQKSRKKVAIDQDQATLLALQSGYRSRYTPRGTLSWLEATIPQMNSWVLDSYADGLASADAALAEVPVAVWLAVPAEQGGAGADRHERLAAEVRALRAALRDVEDERAIEALMVAYHVACDHPTDKGDQVAALFTEDGRWESVGEHGDPAWAAVGHAMLRAKFDRNHERMPFALHHLTGGRITLARDAGTAVRTAHGDWTYFQSCTYRGVAPLWIAGAYHAAFRREPAIAGGRWLIADLQVENHFTTPFDRGWVEVPHVATP